MYADDTVIYVSGPNVEVIKDHLQEDIYCIEEWMNQKRLLFNQEKTNCLLFGTRQKLAKATDFILNLHGKNSERVTEFCYLGVTLDEQLLWKQHINTVCAKATKPLGLLSRIRHCLTTKAALCVSPSQRREAPFRA